MARSESDATCHGGPWRHLFARHHRFLRWVFNGSRPKAKKGVSFKSRNVWSPDRCVWVWSEGTSDANWPGKAALRLFRASVRSYKHRKWDRDWGVPSRRRAVLVEKEGCSERLRIHSDGCSFTAPKHVGEATPRSASFMFPSTSLYKWTLLATGRRTAHASSRKLPPPP